jgi:hypothetical protein
VYRHPSLKLHSVHGPCRIIQKRGVYIETPLPASCTLSVSDHKGRGQPVNLRPPERSLEPASRQPRGGGAPVILHDTHPTTKPCEISTGFAGMRTPVCMCLHCRLGRLSRELGSLALSLAACCLPVRHTLCISKAYLTGRGTVAHRTLPPLSHSAMDQQNSLLLRLPVRHAMYTRCEFSRRGVPVDAHSSL